MPDTSNNGAPPIDLPFVNPFDTDLVKEPAKAVNGGEPGNEGSKPEPTTGSEPTKTSGEPTKGEDDIFDESQYIKNNFGWDSLEAGKAELQRLRELEKKASRIC